MELKCPSCGGALGFSDKTCPYCGRINEKAVSHIAEKERVQASYSEAAQKARQSIFRNRGIRKYALINAILLIGILVNLYISNHIYSIWSSHLESRAANNAIQNCARLDEYLSGGDYMKFASAFSDWRLRHAHGTDAYEPYYVIYDIADDLAYLEQQFLDLSLRIARDPELRNKDLYVSHFKYVSERMREFFDHPDLETYLTEKYRYYKIDAALSAKHMEAMEAQLDALLHTYLGMTDDDLTSLRTLSKEEIAALMEERLLETYR